MVDQGAILDILVYAEFVLENWQERDSFPELKRLVGNKNMNYLLGDFLIRIKNAYMAGRPEVVSPWSKMIEKMAHLLKVNTFIKSYLVVDVDGKKTIKVQLFYKTDSSLPLVMVKIFSKPGRRFYAGALEIPYPQEGKLVIMSTPKGLMTGRQARKKNLGGEVLVELG